MKMLILLYFGTVFANYENNHPRALFHPAGTPDRRHGVFEGLGSNSGRYFQPATFLPMFRSKRDAQVHRVKRDAAGALHIVTNHAQPIHADVKPDGSAAEVTEKPCPINKNKPSHVEGGVVFQVTAPEDTFYEQKSLRKSLVTPLISKLELARSISRAVTLAVLVGSAVVEFFPLLKSLYYSAYSFFL